MIQDPEDELLDQSLRETFSDFDLTPASHIWAGVEGQLAALPKAPRAVPYKLLLPLVGLVGVGVGWLLPRPEAVPPVQVPKTEQRTATPTEATLAAASQVAPPAPFGPAASTVVSRSRQPAARVVVVSATSRARATRLTGQESTGQVSLPAAPAVEPSEGIVATSLTTAPPSAREVLAADSVLTDAAQPAATAGLADSPQAPVAKAVIAPAQASGSELASKPATTGALRPDGAARERRTEYRAATHRRAEKGRGFRRRFVHLTQQVRHIFSPRRSRAAAQPDF